ncbi:MAG: hypothetical protein ABSF29_03060 [Tepidisphaeraceae bacterium]|jgi:hypothetical protein
MAAKTAPINTDLPAARFPKSRMSLPPDIYLGATEEVPKPLGRQELGGNVGINLIYIKEFPYEIFGFPMASLVNFTSGRELATKRKRVYISEAAKCVANEGARDAFREMRERRRDGGLVSRNGFERRIRR